VGVNGVGVNMEPRVRTTVAVFFIAAALGVLLPGSPSLGQDWVPPFRSDEAPTFDNLEGDNRPKAAKRTAVHKARRKPRQYAARAVNTAPARPVHKLAIQVAENNPHLMNLALNNARNVVEYYKAKGEEVPSRS
jgi:hypothetical protein